MSNREPAVYPICLTQLGGALVVVVGGGRVAQRKVAGLLAANAMVRVISPTLTQPLMARVGRGEIDWLSRPYRSGDLEGAHLVFAATNQREINAGIGRRAEALGVLCNVADAQDEGSFHVPAVHRQSGLLVAVSSGGERPRLAKSVRDRIAHLLAGNSA